METIFLTNNIRKSIIPLYLMVTIGLLAILVSYISDSMRISSHNIVTMFLFGLTLYFAFVFLWFIFFGKKKYVIINDSAIQIEYEKNSLKIPLSFISEVKISESPVTHRVWTSFGRVSVGEIGKVVIIVIRPDSMKDLKKIVSKANPLFFRSQLIHFSKDYDEVILKVPPRGGFAPLAESMNFAVSKTYNLGTSADRKKRGG